MGDFEDHFGAGADADSIISGNSRAYEKSSWVEKARWFREPSLAELEKAELRDEYEAWSKSMIARGYIRGPQFSNYDEMLVWDRGNTRPHIRRKGYGGYTVFFTDGEPYEAHKIEGSEKKGPLSLMDDPNIPF